MADLPAPKLSFRSATGSSCFATAFIVIYLPHKIVGYVEMACLHVARDSAPIAILARVLPENEVLGPDSLAVLAIKCSEPWALQTLIAEHRYAPQVESHAGTLALHQPAVRVG